MMYSAPPFKHPPTCYHTCESNICKPELNHPQGHAVKGFTGKTREHVIRNTEYHDGYKTNEVDMYVDRPQIRYIVRPEQKKYAEGAADKKVYNAYSRKPYGHLVSRLVSSAEWIGRWFLAGRRHECPEHIVDKDKDRQTKYDA